MEDKRISVNGVKINPFTSFNELLDHVVHHKGILVAINAEKILHATPQTRDIINRNIGYCDGIGAVMALRRHGQKQAVKLPGCELWLKIIAALYKDGKRFYLVGSKQEKQELLMEEMSERHPAIYQGLGGSFDVYTDYVKRAPQWWVRHNLEFAYRLIKQPSRIKRQIHLVRFWLLVKLGRI